MLIKSAARFAPLCRVALRAGAMFDFARFFVLARLWKTSAGAPMFGAVYRRFLRAVLKSGRFFLTTAAKKVYNIVACATVAHAIIV